MEKSQIIRKSIKSNKDQGIRMGLKNAGSRDAGDWIANSIWDEGPLVTELYCKLRKITFVRTHY